MERYGSFTRNYLSIWHMPQVSPSANALVRRKSALPTRASEHEKWAAVSRFHLDVRRSAFPTRFVSAFSGFDCGSLAHYPP